MKFNLNSALQQAKQNMETFGGYSPSNIKKQVAAIPKWMELSIVNTLDKWNQKLAEPTDVKGYWEDKFGVSESASANKIPKETFKPAPTAVEQANDEFNDQSIIPNRISIADFKVEGKMRDYPYAQAEMTAFDDINEATRSAQITHHPFEKQVRGEGYGENAGFETGPGWEAINKKGQVFKGDWNYKTVYDKKLRKDVAIRDKDGDMIPKTIVNPFTGKIEISEDRGLKRLNNDTFYMALNSPIYRKQAYDLGVIDSPEQMTPEQVQLAWDSMYDPEKNIRMSRVIYNFHEDKKGANQGFSGWYAAPSRFIGKAPTAGVDY